MEKKKTTQHRMTRRAAAHDYRLPGLYHITLHVAEGMGQPLGAVVGDVNAPDGSADAPRTVLTRVGQMVEHELLTAITAHYPMVAVQDYIIMPEHLHAIVKVSKPIITKNGEPAHLGLVIAGFKKGCNRAFWAATGQETPAVFAGATPAGATPAGKPLGTLDAAHGGSVSGGSPAAGPPSAASPVAGSVPSGSPAAGPPSAASPVAGSVPSGSPAGVTADGARRTPSNGSSGRAPLFAHGYCDVMPVDAAQLETQRAYIAGNPRSRLQRSRGGARTHVQRGGIDTALTVTALQGYLQRECPYQATAEALTAIASQLLTAPTNGSGPTAAHQAPSTLAASSADSVPSASPAGVGAAATAGEGAASSAGRAPSGFPAGVGAASFAEAPRFIICDSFGDRSLLTQRLLPVVCHRKDAARFAEQQRRCLEAAAQGAVLVSARIASGEQTIIDEALHAGFPVVLIHDNGFTDRYHPSEERLSQCMAGRLLLISPWQYMYRGKNDQVTVPFCKTMNCVVQALCKTKDNWWK